MSKRGITPKDAVREVCEAAIAYVDHLCAFNDVTHASVHASRLRVASAVDAYHHSIAAEGEDEWGHTTK